MKILFYMFLGAALILAIKGFFLITAGMFTLATLGLGSLVYLFIPIILIVLFFRLRK